MHVALFGAVPYFWPGFVLVIAGIPSMHPRRVMGLGIALFGIGLVLAVFATASGRWSASDVVALVVGVALAPTGLWVAKGRSADGRR